MCVLISQLYQECCFVWNRVCYFGLLARAPSLKRQQQNNKKKKILVPLPICFTSILYRTEIIASEWHSAALRHLDWRRLSQSQLAASYGGCSTNAVFLKRSFITFTQSRHHWYRWRATWRSKSICGRITLPTSWQRKFSTLRWQLSRPTAPSAPSSVPSLRYVNTWPPMNRWEGSAGMCLAC